MKHILTSFIFTILLSTFCSAQTIERIKFGDFNNWVTRVLTESSVIGGATKNVYEIGPSMTITGNKAYVNAGGSPWGTSNVYAKVCGVVKTSNAVYPAVRNGNDKCAMLSTKLEHVKALGFINMDVMVAGSMFLGQMLEPVTSTSDPYSKMNMGIPYTKRPKALVFDYKMDMPSANIRTKATGFGSPKTLQGRDNAVVFILLQHRWEDEKGNLHAKRVGTGGQKFGKATSWINGHQVPIVYGDISQRADLKWLPLRDKSTAYHARNSKGKIKPVIEEGFDANATPTHVIVMISSGCGEPFVGTEGLNFYIDNVGFAF